MPETAPLVLTVMELSFSLYLLYRIINTLCVTGLANGIRMCKTARKDGSKELVIIKL